MNDMVYEHTQPGVLIRWALGLSMVLLAALWWSTGESGGGAGVIMGAVLSLFALALVLMHSLTVRVDEGGITAACGPGLIRRQVPLGAVRAARAVRNPWYYGWGLRLFPGGVLWRVSGLDAIELDLGRRRWLIGTDDPQGLLQAIEQARSQAAGPRARQGGEPARLFGRALRS